VHTLSSWFGFVCAWLLGSQRRGDSRRALLASLSVGDLEMVTRIMNIARGWMLVGVGAFLIARKET
jgi:hypothetical protein